MLKMRIFYHFISNYKQQNNIFVLLSMMRNDIKLNYARVKMQSSIK